MTADGVSTARRGLVSRIGHIVLRVWREAISDHIGVVAAGCAFYAMVALFPAISLLISAYGLIFDVSTVEPQLQYLRDMIPEETQELITTRVHDVITAPRPRLEFSAMVSIAVLVWSASAGTRSLMSSLTLARGGIETRSFIRFHLTAMLLTLGTIFSVGIGMALMLMLPLLLHFTGLSAELGGMIPLAAMLVFLGVAEFGIALLYRYGPAKRPPRFRIVTPGAVLATGLWVAASAGFRWYVAEYASYDRIYGPLGASVVLLLWFYIAGYAILLGGALDVALEEDAAEQEKAAGTPPGG